MRGPIWSDLGHLGLPDLVVSTVMDASNSHVDGMADKPSNSRLAVSLSYYTGTCMSATRISGDASRTVEAYDSHIWNVRDAPSNLATRTFRGCESHSSVVRLAPSEAMLTHPTHATRGCDSHSRMCNSWHRVAPS